MANAEIAAIGYARLQGITVSGQLIKDTVADNPFTFPAAYEPSGLDISFNDNVRKQISREGKTVGLLSPERHIFVNVTCFLMDATTGATPSGWSIVRSALEFPRWSGLNNTSSSLVVVELQNFPSEHNWLNMKYHALSGGFTMSNEADASFNLSLEHDPNIDYSKVSFVDV